MSKMCRNTTYIRRMGLNTSVFRMIMIFGLGFILCGILMRQITRINSSTMTSSEDNMPRLAVGKKAQPHIYDVVAVEETIPHKDVDPKKLSMNRISSFDYKHAMQELNDLKVNQDDPRLIQLIRDYYIDPPSQLPYQLKNPERVEYSNGQTPFVDSRLNSMKGGFYIECGALDAEKGSNTLFFEKVRKWNGLLIEANPANYKALKSKNRKAFSMNVCLHTETYPAIRTFKNAYNLGHIVQSKGTNDALKVNEEKIQCFPLYSILLAMQQLTVDFFSLDVEGDELNVLKTIPWDKVNISMLTVEYVHQSGGSSGLNTYMKKQGYDNLLQVSRGDGGVNDIIFRKKGLNH